MIECVSQVALEFVGAGSDKIYVIQVTKESGSPAGSVNYTATGYYGRRGSGLSKATKYSGPSFPAANVAADKLEREKRGKGYTNMATTSRAAITGMPSGAPVFGGPSISSAPSAPSLAAAPLGLIPMRANPLDESMLEEVLTSPDWAAQRKYDGERSPVSLRRSGIQATNLKGAPRILTATAADSMSTLLARPDFSDERETLLDGEEMPGGAYVAYDITTLRDNDVRKLSFEERFAAMEELLDNDRAIMAETAWTEEDKRAMLARAQTENWEGLMFRKVDAPYVSGRRSFILKHKLWASATCRVLTANAARSVQIAVREADDTEVFIGNVTVPSNLDIPEPDDLIEVRYLYAMDGGSLYQPVLLGPRTDKDEADYRSSLRPCPPEQR